MAILGGNPVIGRALESLLLSANYAARFFSEYPEGEAEPLGGTRVALIMPALSSRHQKALMTLIKNTPSTTNLPLIELVTNENGHGQGNRLPWPCSTESLRHLIDKLLLGDSLDAPDGREPDNPPPHGDSLTRCP